MESLYVVVHPHCVYLQATCDSAPPTRRAAANLVLEEITNIFDHEDFVVLRAGSDPSEVPYAIPDGKEVRVCGAFRDICVASQLRALLANGVDAKLYEPATLD